MDCKLCRQLFIFSIFRLCELELSYELCIERLILAESLNSSFNVFCKWILELKVEISFSPKVIRILLLLTLFFNQIESQGKAFYPCCTSDNFSGTWVEFKTFNLEWMSFFAD